MTITEEPEVSDEPEIETTAQIAIHPGRGTAQSLAVSLWSGPQRLGTLTLGDNVVVWRSADEVTSLTLTADEFARYMEQRQ